MSKTRGATQPVLIQSDDEIENSIREKIKSKLNSIVVPSIQELNDPNRSVQAIQSMMDSMYGEGNVTVHQNEEDKNIVNIGFTETLLITEVKIGGNEKNDNNT